MQPPPVKVGFAKKTSLRRLAMFSRSTSVRAATLLLGLCGLLSQNANAQVTKHGVTIDIRSQGRQIADEVATSGGSIPAGELSPEPGVEVVPQIQLRGGNVQV